MGGFNTRLRNPVTYGALYRLVPIVAWCAQRLLCKSRAGIEPAAVPIPKSHPQTDCLLLRGVPRGCRADGGHRAHHATIDTWSEDEIWELVQLRKDEIWELVIDRLLLKHGNEWSKMNPLIFIFLYKTYEHINACLGAIANAVQIPHSYSI
ncbi:hypothetical protein K1719_044344 [Acacia pycnantha]|nr:hypothetical protein K1719_044344 [Acacia pycnantha]